MIKKFFFTLLLFHFSNTQLSLSNAVHNAALELAPLSNQYAILTHDKDTLVQYIVELLHNHIQWLRENMKKMYTTLQKQQVHPPYLEAEKKSSSLYSEKGLIKVEQEQRQYISKLENQLKEAQAQVTTLTKLVPSQGGVQPILLSTDTLPGNRAALAKENQKLKDELTQTQKELEATKNKLQAFEKKLKEENLQLKLNNSALSNQIQQIGGELYKTQVIDIYAEGRKKDRYKTIPLVKPIEPAPLKPENESREQKIERLTKDISTYNEEIIRLSAIEKELKESQNDDKETKKRLAATQSAIEMARLMITVNTEDIEELKKEIKNKK